ncbi:MAG TPA: glycoside hydrolase family 28 protein [Terracidiphilus sp.]|nr:glycoside hydrolase family 28 protein [Terracidiphilus sp.]
MQRRDLLKAATSGVAMVATPLLASAAVQEAHAQAAGSHAPDAYNVRTFGATGDGTTLDTAAINRAIDAVAAAGGGTVLFPAGMYLSYSIHLKSKVGLHLDQGAVIIGASTPMDGMLTGGYDHAEPQGPWEPYQDYGHNHWHNSLLWGEGLSDVSITGPGMIWGKGLSRGWDTEMARPDSRKPGVGNKAIALKNCHNVLLRDFKILEGGWFGILATGVDNLTIDNLIIDTIRDGMDIDCCRNVRVSNCTVNSPYDDAICPKSSFALGYARPTENLTISNCFVTGGYVVGSVLDGTWKRMEFAPHRTPTGRIKLGTESNGGFLNVTITNCVFESCQGFALESEDGAIVEDITVTGITMRDIRTAPLFLRLGIRMRGPASLKPGVMRRVILSNITSSGASMLPSIVSGVPGHPIEGLKISDVFLQQVGGGSAAMAALNPEERADAYPDPKMFGDLPACGLFARHVRNLQVSNLDVETLSPDARPAFWLNEVDGADFFRVRVPQGGGPAFDLHNVKDFRSFASRGMADITLSSVTQRKI